jgi:RNA polymerase sigma factor (sigma-70 family)
LGSRLVVGVRPFKSSILKLARRYDIAPDDMTSALSVVSYEAERASFRLRADVVQAGLVGLLEALARFDPSRSFRFSTFAAWHIRGEIARLKIRRITTVSIDDEDNDLPELETARPSPDGCAGVRETRVAVRTFVDGLSPQLRQAVRRIYWDGASQADAARELGLSRTAVSKMMVRLRRRGRRRLAHHAPDHRVA